MTLSEMKGSQCMPHTLKRGDRGNVSDFLPWVPVEVIWKIETLSNPPVKSESLRMGPEH